MPTTSMYPFTPMGNQVVIDTRPSSAGGSERGAPCPYVDGQQDLAEYLIMNPNDDWVQIAYVANEVPGDTQNQQAYLLASFTNQLNTFQIPPNSSAVYRLIPNIVIGAHRTGGGSSTYVYVVPGTGQV